MEDIILGDGTYFDPEIALSRALTELNQILPSVLSVKADRTTNYPKYTEQYLRSVGFRFLHPTYKSHDSNVKCFFIVQAMLLV